MKKIGLFVFAAFMLATLGFPANAQESRGGFAMEKTEEQHSVEIIFAENRVILKNLPNDDVLEVFNIMGAKIYSRRVSAGTNEYILSLPRGFYILKVGKITKKIAVK